MRRWAPRLVRVLATLARTYGARGLARRLAHELRSCFGLFKRGPAIRIVHGLGARVVSYRPAGDWNTLSPEIVATAIERGRRVVEGFYEAYGHDWRQLPDTSRMWRVHPRSGLEFPLIEWWKVPLLPQQADVKDVWEPGRFSWVYDLIRANAVASDPAYGRTYHQRLAQWQAANPPFLGPQWACGQETAIRALAILHAEDSLTTPPDDPQAHQRVSTLLAWSAERIANAIGYGLSQRNNHGLSEAAGLVHLGLRLRGAHPRAARWVRLGTRLLDEQIADQFAVDGWYAQHSFTYMRVALEQALLAHRCLQMHGLGLSPASLQRLVKAYELLVAVIDAQSGLVPNHGANDGARILPYSTSAYRDFRPLLTLAAFILKRPLPEDIAPNPEVLCWLGQSAPPRGPGRADGVWVGESGWAVARIGGVAAFLRAGRYTHRPSHLDSLHLDVRFGGREAVVDPGTFSYNAPNPWKNGLTSAAVHNGPLVNDTEPGERGPRFLWYSWPLARIVDARHTGHTVRFVAEIPSRVKREVDVTRDGVHIVDSALDPTARTLQVTWLLHPEVRDLSLIDASGTQRIQAREGDVTGWFSPAYGLRLASTAIRVRSEGRGDALVCSCTIRRPTDMS